MKEIQLTQGKVALVDDEDYEQLNKYKWYATKNSRTYYGVRGVNNKTGHFIVLMHRMIIGCHKGFETDHIDGNGLNNVRSNLRLVTKRGNAQNRHVVKTSKYAGVSWDKVNNRWRSQIRINKHKVYLGSFKSEADAATTYRVAEEVLIHGR